VNLVVSDLERSMNFYTQVAGVEEAYRRPTVRAGFLTNGNTHHDVGMVESAGPLGRGRPAGLNHLAFELETEVDLVEGYNRAIAAGVKFARTADHDIAHAVYGEDPDGNQYEIYADVVREWRAVRSGTVTKPKPNWKPGDTPPSTEKNYEANPTFARVEEAAFHPLRITSATLVVERFVEAVEYYTTIVGLRPVVGNRDAAFAILGGTLGERSVALFRAGSGHAPGLHHMSFVVGTDGDLNAAVDRLRSAGSAPEVQIEHALARAVTILDPDGTRVQFHVDRGRSNNDWAMCDPSLALYLA
jgi:catechol 2,3-dioxygenase